MKQFYLAVATAAAIGMTSSNFAQEEGKRAREGNQPGGEFRERLLKQFDADGDGKLNDEEQAKAREAAAKMRGNAEGAGRMDKAQIMKQFDKDGDGQLNESERKTVGEFMAKRGAAGDATGRRPGAEGAQIPAEVLKRFDKDGDGKLNEEERQAAAKAREEMMKRTGDTAGRPGQGMMSREELTKKFDKNGDGKLDETEQAAAREAVAKFREQRGVASAPGNAEPRESRVDKKELLEKFDADGDGKLNDEERAKAVAEFKNRKKP